MTAAVDGRSHVNNPIYKYSLPAYHSSHLTTENQFVQLPGCSESVRSRASAFSCSLYKIRDGKKRTCASDFYSTFVAWQNSREPHGQVNSTYLLDCQQQRYVTSTAAWDYWKQTHDDHGTGERLRISLLFKKVSKPRLVLLIRTWSVKWSTSINIQRQHSTLYSMFYFSLSSENSSQQFEWARVNGHPAGFDIDGS